MWKSRKIKENQMADYIQLIPLIQKWEGGWSDDPDDPGGATMKGITLRTYRNYCKAMGLPEPTKEDLRNISSEHWNEIFKSMFWNKWKADEIKSQSVANFLVDWYWNSGVWGVKIPQRVLGITDDGIAGPATLHAINTHDPRALFDKLQARRLEYVESLVRNKPVLGKFLKGWKNRINDFQYSES